MSEWFLAWDGYQNGIKWFSHPTMLVGVIITSLPAWNYNWCQISGPGYRVHFQQILNKKLIVTVRTFLVENIEIIEFFWFWLEELSPRRYTLLGVIKWIVNSVQEHITQRNGNTQATYSRENNALIPFLTHYVLHYLKRLDYCYLINNILKMYSTC